MPFVLGALAFSAGLMRAQNADIVFPDSVTTDVGATSGIQSIVPCRIVDTRPGRNFPAPYGAPAFGTGEMRTYVVAGALVAGDPCANAIPPGAAGILANITAVSAVGAGDIRVGPGTALPTSSLLNFVAGETIANASIVPVATDQISVKMGAAGTHLLIDIFGYLLPGAIGPTGPTGASGTNGTNGATGPTGANGATGTTGANGTNGTNGATGATGANGTNGTNGATGATGATGANGTNGTNGATGATGATGASGTNGTNGATGATGATGASGTNGTNGTNGATGATGSTGPTGATGGVLAAADFFALQPADNVAIIPGDRVKFPQDGPIIGTGITRVNNSKYGLGPIGTYLVQFQVSVDEPGQLLVALDSGLGFVEQVNTVVGRAAGSSQIVGMSLVTTTVVDTKLSIQNPLANPVALTPSSSAGGTLPVSAHLCIMRIQ
jgi:hypothetical protein